MLDSKKTLLGFSLMELLITLGVLVVLGAAALPAYLDYMRRQDYTQVIADVPKFKTAVVDCFHDLKTFKGCSGGINHMPPNMTKPTDRVASIIILDGVITVTPIEKEGVKPTDIYIATPKVVNKAVEWVASGASVEKGYVN
jgi:Tfp pilus assembly major pilin PilA